MGIFSLNVSTVKRSTGRRAIAAAAYCSRSALRDDGLGRDVNFSDSSRVLHSEILLPAGAPARWLDRAVLWNEVEATEPRANAQLASELEVVMPAGLIGDEGVGLARDFVRWLFSSSGRVVDLNIQRGIGADGLEHGYLHLMLTMREIVEQGFGKRLDDWHGPKLLMQWRERWAQLSNKHLLEHGRDRTFGSDAAANAARGRGLEALLSEATHDAENYELAWRNGERLLAEPGLALTEMAKAKPTFARADLAEFVRRNTAGEEQFGMALARVESSTDLVRLSDGRLTTRELMGSVTLTDSVGEESEQSGCVGGPARTLREATALWEAGGLRVRGVGLDYELAKKFERASGIKSVAVHGLLDRWLKKKELLEDRDVLVVKDGAFLSDKQKDWMLKAVRAVSAKLVIVNGETFVEIDGRDVGLSAAQLAALNSEGRGKKPSGRPVRLW